MLVIKLPIQGLKTLQMIYGNVFIFCAHGCNVQILFYSVLPGCERSSMSGALTEQGSVFLYKTQQRLSASKGVLGLGKNLLYEI